MRAYIYVERRNRGRYPLVGGKLLSIPKDTTRILLLSIGGYSARFINWPPKKGAKIPLPAHLYKIKDANFLTPLRTTPQAREEAFPKEDAHENTC